MLSRFFVAAGSAILLAAASLPASANIILLGDVTTSTNSTPTGATGKLELHNFMDSAGDVMFNVTLTNLTGQPPNPLPGTSGATAGTLVGFALDLDPFSGFTYDNLGTTFTEVFAPGNLGGIGTFDVCVRSTSGQNCNGGQPTAGLAAGASATVKFTIDTTLNAAAYQSFLSAGFASGSHGAALRFQQVSAGAGSEKISAFPTPHNVPEPATLGVLGVGLVGLGFAAYRRRKAG